MHFKLPNLKKKCFGYWKSLDIILLSLVSGYSKFKTNRKKFRYDGIILFIKNKTNLKSGTSWFYKMCGETPLERPVGAV